MGKVKTVQEMFYGVEDVKAMLGEQISEKDNLLAEDAELSTGIAEIEKDIHGCEAEIKALEQAEALRLEIVRQAEEKEARVRELIEERRGKGVELEELEREYYDALAAKNGLEAARAAAEAVKNARTKIQELAPQVERYNERLAERNRLARVILDKAGKVRCLRADREIHERVISRRAEIEAAQAAIAMLTPKLEDAQARMTEAQAASREKRDAKAAVDQHVSDSRVRIGELEARLNAAKAEAGRLAESGCPAPDNATCKFLTSAVAAQAAIPELSVSLERMKMDDREKYETLMDAYRKAKEKDEALGDPAAEIMDISDEIKKHRAAADLASNLAAATVALAGIDASITEAEKEAADAEAEVKRIDTELESLAVSVTESSEATICIRENEALAETLAACQAAEAKAETLAPQRERLMKERAALAQKVGIASQEAEEIKSRIPAEVSSAAGLRAILEAHRKTSTNYVTRRGEIKAKGVMQHLDIGLSPELLYGVLLNKFAVVSVIHRAPPQSSFQMSRPAHAQK